MYVQRQTTLPEACPVCAHTPLTAESCTENKKLRLTVKAFLKAEEKKRGRDKSDGDMSAVTSSVLAPQETYVQAVEEIAQAVEGQGEVAKTGSAEQADEFSHESRRGHLGLELIAGETAQAQAGVQHEVKRNASNPLPEQAQSGPATEEMNMDGTQEQGVLEGGLSNMSIDWNQQDSNMQNQMGDASFGFNGPQVGFGGMDWNAMGGFNPMMAMQNAMPNGGWNNFPNMMGMSGMNMDPMAMSQGMFGGFGAGGLGTNDMSAMNMGLGFGGGFGGWNAQNNMNGNFGAHATGYYPQGGYNHAQSHQAHFGNQMHHQQFQNNNYPNRSQGQGPHRGLGRGRGGYSGRGGHAQHFYGPGQGQPQTAANGFNAQPPSDDGAFSHQLPLGLQNGKAPQQHSQADGSQSLDMHPGANQNRAAPVSNTVPLADAGEDDDEVMIFGTDNVDNTALDETSSVDGAEEGVDRMEADQGQLGEDEVETTTPVKSTADEQPIERITTLDAAGPCEEFQDLAIAMPPPAPMSVPPSKDLGTAYPISEAALSNEVPPLQSTLQARPTRDFAPRGRVGPRGNFRGRAGYSHVFPGGGVLNHGTVPSPMTTENFTVLTGAPEGPPIDAPKGPKAMREGLPNNGIYSRGGFGASTRGGAQVAVPARSRSRSPARNESKKTVEQNRSPSRSRSRSRHRKRKNREDSRGTSTDSETRNKRRERRLQRERQHDGNENVAMGGEGKKPRSRSSSAEDESSAKRRRYHEKEKDRHRSSRSQRDRSRDRHRHRDRSRSPVDDDPVNGTEDYSSQAAKSRSHRARDRDRDRERDAEQERERDRQAEKRREKDRKRSRRDRSASAMDREETQPMSRRSRHSKSDRKDDRVDDRKEKSRTASIQQATDEIGFKIKGSRSAAQKSATTSMPAPAFAPPKGPKKDRDRERSARESPPAYPPTPTTPATDPHTAERQARDRER
ncbi:hypothetical protein LTR66_012504, partial [Elasticomyces elasticus]